MAHLTQDPHMVSPPESSLPKSAELSFGRVLLAQSEISGKKPQCLVPVGNYLRPKRFGGTKHFRGAPRGGGWADGSGIVQ